MKTIAIAGLVVVGLAIAGSAGFALAATPTVHVGQMTFADDTVHANDTARFVVPVTMDPSKVVLNGVPINTPLAAFAPECKGKGDTTSPCWVPTSPQDDPKAPQFVEIKGLPAVKDADGKTVVSQTLAVVDEKGKINIVLVQFDRHEVLQNDYRAVASLSEALGAPAKASATMVGWIQAGHEVALRNGTLITASNVPK
ncbi:hypothetical protein SAMN05216466_106225 [Paraburkholderia phenazinium]|uniref:Uncharacterized protein n=1 Tax=Paraburkholderia phenazinium TaxID=60549 RepID=A0A1G7YKL3_9BURK|nr:hypothetical protein [Paraburkholderia phenazinium]SDG96934.1 hypothetical protein SAMN05216466_106225 [Paraburkholderia phenazinium]